MRRPRDANGNPADIGCCGGCRNEGFRDGNGRELKLEHPELDDVYFFAADEAVDFTHYIKDRAPKHTSELLTGTDLVNLLLGAWESLIQQVKEMDDHWLWLLDGGGYLRRGMGNSQLVVTTRRCHPDLGVEPDSEGRLPHCCAQTCDEQNRPQERTVRSVVRGFELKDGGRVLYSRSRGSRADDLTGKRGAIVASSLPRLVNRRARVWSVEIEIDGSVGPRTVQAESEQSQMIENSWPAFAASHIVCIEARSEDGVRRATFRRVR